MNNDSAKLAEGRASSSQEHMERMDMAIHIDDLTVTYGDEPVLWDIDIEIPKGTLLGIVGPNGAGKTTVFKSILGLVKPIAGKIYLFGKPAEMQKHLIAYVPQKTSIDWDFPVSVFDVVLMGTYTQVGWLRRPGKAQKQSAMNALKQVGMAEYCDRQIGELSGGQQQRVFIARALVQNADIFLMDEPFQGVDKKTEQTIVEILHVLRDSGKTVIVVHHDLHTIKDYFDWVLLINVRKIALGPVDETFTEESLSLTFGEKNPFLSLAKTGHKRAKLHMDIRNSTIGAGEAESSEDEGEWLNWSTFKPESVIQPEDTTSAIDETQNSSKKRRRGSRR